MPILDSAGRCVGLIDAESFTPGFFHEARVAIVARCALDVASELAISIPNPVVEQAAGKCEEGTHYFVNGRLSAKADIIPKEGEQYFVNGTARGPATGAVGSRGSEGLVIDANKLSDRGSADGMVTWIALCSIIVIVVGWAYQQLASGQV